MQDKEASSRAGLYDTLKGSAAQLLLIGKTRLELFLTEAQEEKIRLVALLIKAIAAVFFMSIGLILGILCLAITFWEQRLIVFGICAIFFVLAALWLFVDFQRENRQQPPLFRDSLDELEADIAALRREVDVAKKAD